MPSPPRAGDLITRRKARRRFAPARLLPRDTSPRAPGQTASGLTNPADSVAAPGCTVWKFFAPPARLNFDGGAIISRARLVPLFGASSGARPASRRPPTCIRRSRRSYSRPTSARSRTLPARTVTTKVAAGGNVLVIESELGQPAGDLEVVRTVTESGLPAGYHSARGDTRAVTVTGRRPRDE